MERISPIREEKIRRLMFEDARTIVSSVGGSEANFNAVKTYFNFDKNCHFVITLIIFNILSLFIAQTECTGNLLNGTYITLIPIFILFGLLVAFILRITNDRVNAAAINATRRWEYTVIAAFVIVLGIEVYLHNTCEASEQSCATLSPTSTLPHETGS